MKVFDVGVEPIGFIAIGVLPRGVVAIGPLATGVVAIGQVAHPRGVRPVVVGRLVAAVRAGQLVEALAYRPLLIGCQQIEQFLCLFDNFAR